MGPDTCILPSSCSAPSQAAPPFSLPSPLHPVTGRGRGFSSVPEAPPLIGPQPGPECRACVWGRGKGGVAKIFAPLSNACYVIPPLPRLCIADSALASPRCFSLWLAASPTSREGPAHSSMSEPQPGRAQRQGRRGGRAGAGLRHPGRVSSQVPPRAGRGALHARPTESAAGRPRCPPGAFAGGGKRPPPPLLHPACLRMRQTGRPLLAAGGAGGWGGAGGARPEETQQPEPRAEPPPRSACGSGRRQPSKACAL